MHVVKVVVLHALARKEHLSFILTAYSPLFGTQSYVFRLNFVIQPVKLQRKQFFFKRTRFHTNLIDVVMYMAKKPACLY